MCCSRLQSAIGIGDGTPGVVVKVAFNIAGNHSTESSDEVINLSGGRTSDSVCDANSLQNS